MNHRLRIIRVRRLAVVLCASLAALPAQAGGNGHGKGHDQGQGPWPNNPPTTAVPVVPGGVVFAPGDRAVIANYYAAPIAAGHCPPGLAKKGNGCLPPGQARKYVIGQRLPYGVVTYPLPPDLLMRLTPAPAGYQYCRIGSDVVLLGIGTSMVVAALQDLVR